MTHTSSTFRSTPMMRALAACIRAGVPTLLESDPGQAKSATVEAAATQWGYHTMVVTGSNRDATDFLGLPYQRDDGFTGYSDMSWAAELNAADKALLFLDEFGNCTEEVMQAMHRVLQERYVGNLRLREHVVIVAAKNPTSIATGGRQLSSAVANRMIHLDWQPDTDLWAEGLAFGFDTLTYPDLGALAPGGTAADIARARGLVAGYLSTAPQHVNAHPGTDPDAASKGWASMRSWTNLADAMAMLDPADDSAVLLLAKGAVGASIATPFMQWVAQADLMDPREAIDHPDRIPWDSRPDRMFALGAAICGTVEADGDPALWGKALRATATCVPAGRVDNGWMIARRLLNHQPAGATAPRQAVDAFAEQMEQAGMLAPAAP